MKPTDPLDALLQTLPSLDVEATAAERIRTQALAQLGRAATQTGSSRLEWLMSAWHRALEPAIAAGVTVVYLGWAGKVLWAILGPHA